MHRRTRWLQAVGLVASVGLHVPAWAAGITQRVSIGLDGVQGNDGSFDPALSAGGQFVAFSSWASNLVPGDTNGVADLFVRDRQAGTTERVSIGSNGVQGNGRSFVVVISSAGRFVAFSSDAGNLVPGDTNSVTDVFLRDRGLVP